MANPIVAATGTASDQSIYDSSSTKHHRVGTRAFLDDGRVFYYTLAGGTTLAVGKLVQAQAVGTFENLATGTSCAVVGNKFVTDITLGSTAATANQFEDGYIAFTDGGAEGHIYRIRGNDAADASATDMRVELYDEIKVASDANTTITLLENLYKDTIIGATGQTGIMVGVAPAAITNAEYGWLQTWGPCPVLCDEAVTAVGQAMTIGSSVAGAAEEDDTDGSTQTSQEYIIGHNITAFVDAEYQVVDLMIRP